MDGHTVKGLQASLKGLTNAQKKIVLNRLTTTNPPRQIFNDQEKIIEAIRKNPVLGWRN